jgi:acetyl-CoA synthetase
MLRRADIEYRILDAGVKALITSDATVADEVDALKDRISIETLFFSGQRAGWRDFRQEVNSASRTLTLEKNKKSDPLNTI